MNIDLIPFEPGMEGKFVPYELLEQGGILSPATNQFAAESPAAESKQEQPETKKTE